MFIFLYNKKYNKEISMFVCPNVILYCTMVPAGFLASAMLLLPTAEKYILMTSCDVMFIPNFVKINFIPKQWALSSE